MSYNRKIFYMNFYEGDEKKGNAGYIKVLKNGETLETEVRLSGVPAVFDGEKELVISANQIPISTLGIILKNGQGMTRYVLKETVELSQLSFDVQLAPGCFLATGQKKQQNAESGELDNVWQEAQEKIMLQPKEETVEPVPEEVLPQLEIAEEKEEIEEEAVGQEGPFRDKVENRKWKQICKVYPHIQPFQDFREYIKLELKDMVLISEKKYSLVENSFLLHGYYNYDHIILWKKEKTPVKYYIGVPGNFYEKEKQVAVLYGFESFEGAVEPAKEGDFGYYMTEVSI